MLVSPHGARLVARVCTEPALLPPLLPVGTPYDAIPLGGYQRSQTRKLGRNFHRVRRRGSSVASLGDEAAVLHSALRHASRNFLDSGFSADCRNELVHKFVRRHTGHGFGIGRHWAESRYQTGIEIGSRMNVSAMACQAGDFRTTAKMFLVDG